MNKKLFVIVFSVLLAHMAFGQKFSGGFKAGYNLNYFNGPALTNSAGESVQSYRRNNGFHVGAIINYSLNKYFGLRTNVLYSQRGYISQYHSTDSYLLLRAEFQPNEFAFGEKTINISVNNSYLEIPLMIYGKYKRFELVFGPSLGLLVTSGASGSIKFNGEWRRKPVDIDSRINHLYYSQKAASYNLARVYTFTNGNQVYTFPENHLAYYEFDEKKSNTYVPINYGLTAELNYFFNKGLFIGVGYYYGLNDVTSDEMDLDWENISVDREILTRKDVDKLSTLRISVGFRF